MLTNNKCSKIRLKSATGVPNITPDEVCNLKTKLESKEEEKQFSEKSKAI